MKDRWLEFNPTTDIGDPQFEVGMKFSDCKVFRFAVREQFINMNMDVVFVKMVESECKDSWVWFSELLVKDVEIVNQFGHIFISDKQKGLLPAFEQVVLNSEHRFCARHLFTNFILQFKGKALSDKFWGAAKATTVPQFARQMEELKNLDKDTYNWLIEP
ncbi:hypothetical protein L3X38_035954 [Prunus dulcis]|uniref:MULE transposase domain-containing protein n=1 Tax=Prunus dulcis TaxID=3755 RepID=A0AAD4VKP3_PRUDU|nr:hypothetical protein L3X38_035954 [Prunus dulcis]